MLIGYLRTQHYIKNTLKDTKIVSQWINKHKIVWKVHNKYTPKVWEKNIKKCNKIIFLGIWNFLWSEYVAAKDVISWELDGVGPADNKPSTDKRQHFVHKIFLKKYKKKYCDMWHMTHDMWHVTCDTWHVTCDILCWVNII